MSGINQAHLHPQHKDHTHLNTNHCTCHQSAIQQSLSTTKEHTSPPFPVEP